LQSMHTQYQLDSVTNAWNELSDQQRKNVESVEIEVMTDKQYDDGIAVGTFRDSDKRLQIRLNPYDVDLKDTFDTVHHEVAHAEFSKLQDTEPAKVKKFNETVTELQKSGSINRYVDSFKDQNKKRRNTEMALNKLESSWRMASERDQKDYKDYYEDQKKIINNNLKQYDTLYADETHSALAEELSGTSTNTMNPKLDSKQRKKLFNAYKELHGY